MLTQRGRYALKALLNLARANGGSRDVGTISSDENIPRKFLEAIMSDLRRARLVESTRGKLGGYRLARPADLITFGEIMRVTNGPLALVSCASRAFYRRCEDCPDEAACILRRVLGSVRDEVSEILDRTTLADGLTETAPAAAEILEAG
jgi:Rrf2 family protein